MKKKYNYNINFASGDPFAPRVVLKGTVTASSLAMAAHRAVLHARNGIGNKAQFDRIGEIFVVMKEDWP